MPTPALLVAFRVGEIRFGVAAASVVEVTRAAAVSPLPGAPAVVEGLVNYRGTVIPVFDAGRRFTDRSLELRASHSFIVADTSERRVALHVELVDGLIETDATPIEPPVALQPDAPVIGVIHTEDGLLILHDLGLFLSHAESWALDRALSAKAAAV